MKLHGCHLCNFYFVIFMLGLKGSVAELALKRNFQISREPNEKRGGILGLKYADD